MISEFPSATGRLSFAASPDSKLRLQRAVALCSGRDRYRSAGLSLQVNGGAEESYGRLDGRGLVPSLYLGGDRWIGSADANLSSAPRSADRQKALIERASQSADAAAMPVVAARLALTFAVVEIHPTESSQRRSET